MDIQKRRGYWECTECGTWQPTEKECKEDCDCFDKPQTNEVKGGNDLRWKESLLK